MEYDMNTADALQSIFTQRINHALDNYRKYTAIRKEHEKFLKNSRNVCHDSWRIHKKLYDERFGRVYVQTARGQGKQRELEEYLSLLEEGRDVKVVTSKDISLKKFEKPITLKAVIEDKDLFFPEPWRREISDAIYKEFLNQLAEECDLKTYFQTCNPYEWKPIVRHDDYIFSGKYVYPYYMNNALLCNIVKDSIFEVIDTMKGITHDN